MSRCPSCGEQNPAHARFCLACATLLADASASESRRTVTILFADMVASTARAGRLDPEVWRGVQSRYFTALRAPIERHGGTVEKFIGDAVMAVFGWPTLHEDDALRAVRAAAGLTPALEELNAELGRHGAPPIELRVGVQTGEVLAADGGGGGGALVTGDAVNVAARLQQAAGPGEVLLGGEAARLVRDAVETVALGAVVAKGTPEGIDAHRLVRLTGEQAHRRRIDTPLVGRTAELGALELAFRRAVDTREIELLTVVAPAGVGKSRLVREFLDRTDTRATVLGGRCLNYGDGITYWALAEIVRAAAGIAETDAAAEARERVAGLVASDPQADRVTAVLSSLLGLAEAPATGDDISWAARRTLAMVATDRPLVLLVEDVHWAAPDLLDLLEALLDWGVGVPVLLVCTTRPELAEVRPAFGAGRTNATILHLEALGPAEAEALLDELPGGAALPAALRERITTAAEGNPLFVEEMLGMLVDLGQLRRTAAGWVMRADVAGVAVPSSIRALLAARIDALEREERNVAERAAVVGRTFERSAVAELSPEAERGRLAGRLLSLTRKQLIRPDAPGRDGDDAFRFRHVLVRDAAYDALPKAQRADLHERFAAWLDRTAGDRRSEYAEILAHHLATATEYHAQLGSLVTRADLFDAALAALLEAADRAEQVHAYPEQVRLLRRAISLADEVPIAAAPADVVDLLERAAEAAWHGGDHDIAVELGDAALARVAEGEVTRRARLHANAAAYERDVGNDAAVEAHVAAAVRLLAGGGEPRERAVVLARLARMLMLLHRGAESEALCREVIASGAADETTRASAHITLGTALFDLLRVEEAQRHFAEGRAYAEADGSGIELGRWYNNYAMMIGVVRGQMDAASLLRDGVEAMAERGLARTPAATALALNLCSHDIESGHADRAATAMQDLLGSGLLGADAVWAATNLGLACVVQAKYDEARDALDLGRRLAVRWAGAVETLDLAWVEAELCLWIGAPERSNALARESRVASPPGDTVAAARADGLRIRALADIAARARVAGDDPAEAAAVRQAEAVTAAAYETIREHPFAGPQLHHGEALQASIQAEVARARGASDASLWAECARLERQAGWRAAAAYSEWQRARALEAAGAGGEVAEIRDAMRAGLADPIAMEPARRELVAMAERLGIDLAAAMLPDEAATPDRGGD